MDYSKALRAMGLLSAVAVIGLLGPVSVCQAQAVVQDCPICPEMVVLPAGSVVMGTLNLDPKAYAARAERETSTQRVAAFAMGRFEVTQAQWLEYLKDEPMEERRLCTQWNAKRERFEEADVPNHVALDEPVSCISFNEVQGYLQWLSRVTGKTYRLPSEAEWEYAAKAGAVSPYPWGDEAADACDSANVYDQSAEEVHSLGYRPAPCHDGFVGVAPVGSLHANAWGLYDVVGNVAEWVGDCYTESFVGRPNDGRAWVWSGGCGQHVVKGGSFDSPLELARPGARLGVDNRARFQTIGFRVAMDVIPQTSPTVQGHQ